MAEFVGTPALSAAVVGSGIMGMLYILIVVLGPIAGAHLDPAVTLVLRLERAISTRDATVRSRAAGGCLGRAVAVEPTPAGLAAF